MITPACKDVVDIALDRIRGLFSSSEVDEDQCVIQTPFLYPDNTPISIYIERVGSELFDVTDRGEASDYAFLNGVGPQTLADRLVKVERRWRLQRDGDDLRLRTSEADIAGAVTAMIGAIQDTAYLIYQRADRPR